MIDEQSVLRARRWRSFYDEEGGLNDMLAAIGRTYIERMSAVEPWETEKLAKLAMANKIVQQVDACVREIIDAGKVAENHIEHVKRIEKLPASKRRFI